jgi:hypothetical protein
MGVMGEWVNNKQPATATLLRHWQAAVLLTVEDSSESTCRECVLGGKAPPPELVVDWQAGY